MKTKFCYKCTPSRIIVPGRDLFLLDLRGRGFVRQGIFPMFPQNLYDRVILVVFLKKIIKM